MLFSLKIVPINGKFPYIDAVQISSFNSTIFTDPKQKCKMRGGKTKFLDLFHDRGIRNKKLGKVNNFPVWVAFGVILVKGKNSPCIRGLPIVLDFHFCNKSDMKVFFFKLFSSKIEHLPLVNIFIYPIS